MSVLGLRVLAAAGAGLLASVVGRRLALLRAPLAACLPLFCLTLGLTGCAALGWTSWPGADVASGQAWAPLFAFAAALALLTVPVRERGVAPPGRIDHAA